jgi:UDP-glucose 4-epimerase
MWNSLESVWILDAIYIHNPYDKNVVYGESVNMNIAIIGAAGFIGTNLAIELIKKGKNRITAVDEKISYFSNYPQDMLDKMEIIELKTNGETNFDECLKGQDIVYYLASTISPAASNIDISRELTDNIQIAVNLLESCIKNKVAKIVFVSSGGTVYGKEVLCPISETALTQPINTYGIQKLAIEKLIYLYHHLYGLEYLIVRLSNPFGPYQRPESSVGVVSTFICNALKGKEICIFGDGSVIRDYIYISDAVEAIISIADSNTAKHHIYNIGSGKGTSVNQIVNIIVNELGLQVNVKYVNPRKVDVPVNYLDISRYEKEFGNIQKTSLIVGMRRTMDFFQYSKGEKDENRGSNYNL